MFHRCADVKILVNFAAMADTLPIFEAQFTDEDGGVQLISLVTEPAMESDFVALNKMKGLLTLAVSNPDKMEIVGAIMIPDKLIYRRDDVKGEYYIKFSADQIKKAAYKYAKEQRFNLANVQHETPVSKVTLVESWLTGEKDKTQDYGLNLPKGTWAGLFKVENPAVWQAIKAGELRGFSIEGWFEYLPAKTTPNKEETKQHKHKSPQNKFMNFLEKLAKFFEKEVKAKKFQFKHTRVAFAKNVMVKLMDAVLEDGTEIFIDEETKGVYNKATGEVVADGMYMLADGSEIEVAGGMIKEMEVPAAETPAIPEEKKKEEVPAAETPAIPAADGVPASVSAALLSLTKKVEALTADNEVLAKALLAALESNEETKKVLLAIANKTALSETQIKHLGGSVQQMTGGVSLSKEQQSTESHLALVRQKQEELANRKK